MLASEPNACTDHLTRYQRKTPGCLRFRPVPPMEHSRPGTILQGRPPLPTQDGIDFPFDDARLAFLTDRSTPPHKNSTAPTRERRSEATRTLDKGQSCDRLRPEEERQRSRDSMTSMSTLLIGKTVTPFLKEHIPSLYAPVGKSNNEQSAKERNPNTKYCYRHQPGSKCRRAADEAKMVMIQSELDKLTSAVSASSRAPDASTPPKHLTCL